ncbi:hypothetical protein [Albimonas pacifica]|uniref:Uncharacterized protein n=1 Tax=Albimonas pacifica TaxID=1114924 RepID=A0A1I3IF68_9RHOB|nr:hypothetical protein [Albimonas pacifica]SFI46433.1 hypothetical protein SAMN05216258_10711 [Albimonas pacifica]
MPRREARTLAPVALAALLALAGCAGQPGAEGYTSVTTPMHDTAYDPRQIFNGVPMPLEVHGTPPDGASPAQVAAGMTLPARFGSSPFELGENLREETRVVIAFAPANRLDGCRGPASTGAGRADGALEALIAYCRGRRELSSVLVRSTATRGPGDAGFAKAMNQAFLTLLPNRGPDEQGERRRRR